MQSNGDDGGLATAERPVDEPLPPSSPSFLVGGPTTTSWREHALTRIHELRALANWIEARTEARDRAGEAEALVAVREHLRAAQQAAEGDLETRRQRAKSTLGGAVVERAWSNLDAAESELLRVAPESFVRGQMPNVVAHVRHHLPADDPRRVLAESIAARKPGATVTAADREALVTAVRMASLESRREIMRVRSFRNVLLVSAAVLTLVAVGMVLVGALKPDAMPLCFNPGTDVVCPTGVAELGGGTTDAQAATASPADADPLIRQTASSWDFLVVALVGLIAAAVAAAAALRSIKGTTTPYSLPIALAVLKLPTGVLTAILGLLLMRGEFVPGLSALDSPAQIISWAIILGYAQQVLTGMVDRRAQVVLDDVGGGGNRPAADPAAPVVQPTA